MYKAFKADLPWSLRLFGNEFSNGIGIVCVLLLVVNPTIAIILRSMCPHNFSSKITSPPSCSSSLLFSDDLFTGVGGINLSLTLCLIAIANTKPQLSSRQSIPYGQNQTHSIFFLFKKPVHLNTS